VDPAVQPAFYTGHLKQENDFEEDEEDDQDRVSSVVIGNKTKIIHRDEDDEEIEEGFQHDEDGEVSLHKPKQAPLPVVEEFPQPRDLHSALEDIDERVLKRVAKYLRPRKFPDERHSDHEAMAKKGGGSRRRNKKRPDWYRPWKQGTDLTMEQINFDRECGSKGGYNSTTASVRAMSLTTSIHDCIWECLHEVTGCTGFTLAHYGNQPVEWGCFFHTVEIDYGYHTIWNTTGSGDGGYLYNPSLVWGVACWKCVPKVRAGQETTTTTMYTTPTWIPRSFWKEYYKWPKYDLHGEAYTEQVALREYMKAAPECADPYYSPFTGGKQETNAKIACWTPRPQEQCIEMQDPIKIPIGNLPEMKQFMDCCQEKKHWIYFNPFDRTLVVSNGTKCGHTDLQSLGILRLLIKHKVNITESHFVDTNCGVCSLSAMLADAGMNVMGVTRRDTMHSSWIAAQRGIPVYVHEWQKNRRFPGMESRTDVVYCCRCNVAYPEYIPQVQRLLRPGAFLVIDSYTATTKFGNGGNFTPYCMKRIGTIDGNGWYLHGKAVTAFFSKTASASRRVEDLSSREAEELYESGLGPMSVYQKMGWTECRDNPARTMQLCTKDEIDRSPPNTCLSKVQKIKPQKIIDFTRSWMWNDMLMGMGRVGILQLTPMMKTVSIMNANAFDMVIPIQLKAYARAMWNRAPESLHITNVWTPRSSLETKVPGAIYHDWCTGVYPGHPRTQQLILFEGVIPVLHKCKRQITNVNMTQVVGHMMMEWYRLLRPGGHIVVSSQAKYAEEMETYFAQNATQYFRKAHCWTLRSDVVCVFLSWRQNGPIPCSGMADPFY